MDVVTIRQAKEHDLPAAADCWNAIVKEAWSEDWDQKYPNWRSMFLAVVEKRMAQGLQRYYVAEADGEIVGTAGAQVGEAFFGAVRGYIEGVYVVPAFRRRGVASRLMRECIEWLRPNGVRFGQIAVNGRRPAVIRIAGFRTNRRAGTQTQPRQAVVCANL